MSGPFTGAVDVETLTTLTPGTDGGTTLTFLEGYFASSNDWQPCTIDAGICCLYGLTIGVRGLSAGLLTLTTQLDDGGIESTTVSPTSNDGRYHSVFSLPTSGDFSWVSDLSASGDVIPPFDITGSRLQGPTPVLVPDLSELTSLPTSQDWTVPLVPSQLEYGFIDHLIISADAATGLGAIVCQVGDEGALNPPLVVPASLLARFNGHQGTILIYRDDFRGEIDAGALSLDYRVGVGAQTATNAVTFTP